MSDSSATRADPDFGIYVHWPFCAQKCPYCDFNSHVRHNGWDEDRFLAAFLQELSDTAGSVGRRTVTSIFFGGGTPSLMKPATVAAILERIGNFWRIEPDAEITLEANPGSVEAGRFQGYRSAGVNRVSMGFQSLRDDELKRLGRIHSVADAKAALKIARRVFERTSFDLIYARPAQTPTMWREELAEALELADDHVSLYQLTIEPDTPYAALHAAGKLVVPDEDAALALYAITQELTAARGLQSYEISNYARPGSESRHNLLYWRYGEYAGIGPGAHGRLVVDGVRYATVAERNPETWMANVESRGHGRIEETVLSELEQADEMLLMGLRLHEGLDLDRLAQLGGVRIKHQAIEHLKQIGMIEVAAGKRFNPSTRIDWRRNELDAILACTTPGLVPEVEVHDRGKNALQASVIRATPKGRFVLNTVVAELSKNFEPVT